MDEFLEKLLKENLTPSYCCKDGDYCHEEDLLNDRIEDDEENTKKEK